MRFSRMYIMGPPGSGKTVIAKKIAEKTGIKNFDLDDAVYRENEYKKINPKSRNKKLRKILKDNSKWIIEGSYAHPWILPALKKADCVVIINKKRKLIISRLIMRYLKRKLGFDKAKKGAGTINGLTKLIGYASTYPKDYYLKHTSLARKNNKHPIILRTPEEARFFVEQIICNK